MVGIIIVMESDMKIPGAAAGTFKFLIQCHDDDRDDSPDRFCLSAGFLDGLDVEECRRLTLNIGYDDLVRALAGCSEASDFD
ncbi:hypothetical protein EYC84_010915 [Monilinia fructicola]|uniref:Uncharacterized protein n=1 Tax=Monilinia fructicola TaxID=38448 RepID=A0A5M9JBZ0_MONFR|nr:hypothetical protein EYC84_010915 [Monilinia fructicola]